MSSRVSIRGFVTFLVLFFYIVLLFHLNTGSITICSFFCILVLLSGKKNILNNNTLLLLLYSFSFALIMFLKGSFSLSSIVDTVLPPFCFYLFGMMVVDHYYLKQDSLFVFLLCTSLFFGLYCYYETIKDIISTGYLMSSDRWLMINGVRTAATFVGTNICMGLVGLSAFFLIKEWKIRLGFIIVWLLSVLSTIHMVNRTGVLTTILCLILVLMSYYRKTRHFSKVVWISLLLLVLVLLMNQIPIIKDVFAAYAERESYGDESAIIAGGGRTGIWLEALTKIPTHPFGWTDPIGGFLYAHNMWLDVAKQAGWIPFIFLIIITIKSINSIRKIVRIQNSPLTCILLGLNFCMLTAAFVEPVLGGVFFASYCMFWGFQERYYNLIRNSK